MNRKSKKVVSTELWVDRYIIKNKFPPTYDEVAKHFKIQKTAAWHRCMKFRSKMKQVDSIKKEQSGSTKVKLEMLVPNNKFTEFAELLSKINKLLKH